MNHLPQLIQDLALILVVAAMVSLSFKRLRQPVVLGYLVAGMLVGPHQTFLPQVSDMNGVGIWADIGLIFLLFAIGLEFSFRKLARLGVAPGVTAIFETTMMALTGFVTGLALGWPTLDCLFLGAILAISSTTVLIKTFDELGLKGRRFVSLVVGVLIFEDLVAVLLMVVLTTIASTREFHGLQLLVQILRLGFFIALWFLIGVFALPHITRKIRPLLNAESALVVSLGLCFGMVVLATKAGFSPALGAFIMGSLLAETSEGERIERVIRPVKDLFSAVFFVSVGMLINPELLTGRWSLVVILAMVLILGKVIFVTLGAVIAGQPVKTAFAAGMSLPQIGEFSYIIAGLGVTTGVVSDTLYPLAVAVSVLTAFTTPYFLLSTERVFAFLQTRLSHGRPQAMRGRRFHAEFGAQKPSVSRPAVHYLRGFCLKIFSHSVLIVAIFLLMSELVLPWSEEHFANHPVLRGSLTALTLFLCAPFYWGLAFSKVDGQGLSLSWKRERPRIGVAVLALLRFLAGVALMAYLISQFLFEESAILLVVSLLVSFTILFFGPLQKIYGVIEEVFLKNLHRPSFEDKEDLNLFELPALAPWDAHLVELLVKSEAECVGKTLYQLRIRETFGVSIALIKRGDRRITAPGRRDMLMPQDHIFAIGSDEQLLKFKRFLDREVTDDESFLLPVDYSLEVLTITPECQLAGRTIHESQLRSATRGMVVGIERAGIRMLNPDSGMVFDLGDLVWIVGDRRRLRDFEQSFDVDAPAPV